MPKKNVWLLSNGHIRKYSNRFFAQVNIEFTIGHQRSSFADVIFLRNCAIISEPIVGKKPRGKLSMSLLQLFRQHSARLTYF